MGSLLDLLAPGGSGIVLYLKGFMFWSDCDRKVQDPEIHKTECMVEPLKSWFIVLMHGCLNMFTREIEMYASQIENACFKADTVSIVEDIDRNQKRGWDWFVNI